MSFSEDDESELLALTDLLEATIAALLRSPDSAAHGVASRLQGRIARYCASNPRIGEALRHDGGLRLAMLGSLAAAAPGPGRNEFVNRLRQAVLELERSDPGTGTSAYQEVHGAGFYQDLNRNAAWDDSWAQLMGCGADSIAEEVLGVLPCRPAPWTAVDLGGGDGTFVAALARRCAEVERAVVVERPRVARAAERLFGRHGLAPRCAAVAGDLFDTPLPSADVYFLVSVLHEWPDVDAVRILQNIRMAMSESSELYVVERVFDSGRDDAELVASLDLLVLALSAGRERTIGELGELCRSAGLDTPTSKVLASGRAILRVAA